MSKLGDPSCSCSLYRNLPCILGFLVILIVLLWGSNIFGCSQIIKKKFPVTIEIFYINS